jgi:hypothetical protein
MRAYSDPSRADETYSLPDIEIFYADDILDDDGETMPAGYYWWVCLPGCMPDSDPHGPFETEQEALEDAQS